MDDKQIEKDRQERVTKAKKEIEDILRKYDLDITAEDMIGEHTKLKVMVQFVDTKKYPDAKLAQPPKEVLEELLTGPGDPIGKPKKKWLTKAIQITIRYLLKLKSLVILKVNLVIIGEC